MTPREAYIQAHINGVFSLTPYEDFKVIYGEEWYEAFMAAPFFEDLDLPPDMTSSQLYAEQAYDALPDRLREWSVEAHLVALQLAGGKVRK